MDKKNNESVLTPLLLLAVVFGVAYVVTPHIDKFERFLESDDPAAFAVLVVAAVVLGMLLVCLEGSGKGRGGED
jgi:type III secretory pathway component EscT